MDVCGPTPLPGSLPEDDFDLAADFDRWVADIEAGRERIPAEWEVAGPQLSVSLGDAADVDPALLAAMCGPDGLGGESLSPAFGQDKAADVLPPGPVLAALTEQAMSGCSSLSDDRLVGALRAARRLANRAAYLETVAIAEFARRHEVEREEAKSRKVPLHCRPGQFPGEELAMELVCSPHYADERIWEATDLATRLPRTLAGMADGTIDPVRAYVIWSYTWCLKPAHAAHADEILAAIAPSLRPDQLARKAAALEMKLDPEAVKQRRAQARREGQRVEVKHERSGNAMIAGREMDPVVALAAKANIDALAAQLRNANYEGSLQHLRARVMAELLQSRNPLDSLTPDHGQDAGMHPAACASADQDPAPAPIPAPAPDQDAALDSDPDPDQGEGPDGWQDDPGYRDTADDDPDDDPDAGHSGSPEPHSAGVAPLPALINVTVPIDALLAWPPAPAPAPARVGAWGLLDADQARALVQAASRSPRTRWCMTLIAPDGTAAAHGCSTGQHPWTPPSQGPPGDPPPTDARDNLRAQLIADLIRRLNVKFRPIARGSCDHADAEDRYTPSRRLRHLIRARTETCTAPGCNAQAIYCDLDHTIPYPDGPTCQCNLVPRCRRHHRAKQAPGWNVEQPQPDVSRWTVPSGRTYTTHPTVYET